MKELNQLFYKALKKSWGRYFPALLPVHLEEVPQCPKGSNYICDKYFTERGLVYFFHIQFSQKRRGEFTLNVSVSNSKQRSILEGRGASDLEDFRLGTYRIAAFLKCQDYWWALKDLAAEADAFLNSLGGPPSELSARPIPHRWRPKTYEAPFDEIIEQALADLNRKIQDFVLPQLRITLAQK